MSKYSNPISTGMDEWWCEWYTCSECGKTEIAEGFNFCPNCGIEVDWVSVEDEEED